MKKIKLNIQKFAGSTFEFAASGYLQGRIIWSSTSNGPSANSSNVTATLQVHRTNSATTTGTFSGTLNINGDNRAWSYYGSISNSWVSVYSFSITVPHENDGSKSCYIGGSVTGPSGTSLSGHTSSGYQTVTLDKINRYPSISSATNFTDEENPTITFVNYGTFNIRVKIEAGGNTQLIIRDISKTLTSYTFELTDDERNVLRSLTPNNNSLSVRLTVCAMNGNTELSASYLERTMTIVNANPIFNNFEFEDINNITLALTGNNKYNVNGYSTIQATISEQNKAIAQKFASINKYRFIIGDKTIDINYSDTSNVNGIINNSQSGTYNVYAIDSRNNSTLVTKLSDKNIDYKSIDFNSSSCKVERDNGGIGSNAILTLSGYIWNDNFGIKENSIKNISYKYKKTTDTEWIPGPTTITPTLNENSFSFNGKIGSNAEDFSFDIQSSYDFIISISDELSTKEIQLTPMSSAIPNISLADKGVGIMCDYNEELGGNLQVGGEIVSGTTNNYSTSSDKPYSANYINDRLTYSGDEVVIGTWFGKTLYRKCFKGSGKIIPMATNINGTIDDVVKLIVTVSDKYNWRPIPWNYNSATDTNYMGGSLVRVGGSIIDFQLGNGLSTSDGKWTVILEYTKQ